MDMQSQLEATIEEMVQRGKGILAADESSPTIAKRFASIHIESCPFHLFRPPIDSAGLTNRHRFVEC